MTITPSKSGIWIIRTQKHLQDFVSSNLAYYDATILSGQSGRLMERLRKLELVDYEKLKVLAADVGILPSQLNSLVLPDLEKIGVVDTVKDGTGKVVKIAENIPSTEDIFPCVTELWNSREGTDIELATIYSQEILSELPVSPGHLSEKLRGQGFDQKGVDIALDLQSSFDIVGKAGEGKDILVYSEYSWGEIMKKGGGWLSKLETDNKALLESMIGRINEYQGLPAEVVDSSPDLFRAAQKAGLLRTTTLTTSSGDVKDFVFAPSVGEIFSDENDEVKAFLAALRYGENYSKTSRIKNPLWIVNALIERPSHQIGPASAIGTDFVMLEKAGIVSVEPSAAGSTLHYMKLRKDDVARKVREVLLHGTVSGLHQEKFDTLLSPSSMTTPETNRIRVGKLGGAAAKAQEQLFRILRREEL